MGVVGLTLLYASDMPWIQGYCNLGTGHQNSNTVHLMVDLLHIKRNSQ